MQIHELLQEMIRYAERIDPLELIGLLTGLLAVVWLIRQNTLTWPAGIVYVLVSIIIFWKERLYADLILHVVYLFLNLYGWYYWLHGSKKEKQELRITTTSPATMLLLVVLSLAAVAATGYIMHRYTDASLPYWDSATTVLSLSGMWLTARKKIENWYFWFIVDVLATGVYFYKEIYFYAFLYMMYVGMAINGYVVWKNDMKANG